MSGLDKKVWGAVIVIFALNVLVVTMESSSTHEAQCDFVQAEMSSVVGVYQAIVRSARSLTQKYEMYLRDAYERRDKDLLQEVKRLMMGASFGMAHEYFILRTGDGMHQLEVHRGALRNQVSSVVIAGDEQLASMSDITLFRGCTINDEDYVCLIDIPNRRDFIPNEFHVYSIIALSVSEASALIANRIRDRAIMMPQFRVDLRIQKAERGVHNAGLFGTALRVEKPLGEGVSIVVGTAVTELVKSVVVLQILFTVVLVMVLKLVRRVYARHLLKHNEELLMRERIESLDRTKLLIRGVIHDIKSPMTMVKSIANNVKDDTIRKMLEMANSRMAMIISDLELNQYYSEQGLVYIPLHQVLPLIVEQKRQEYADSLQIASVDSHSETWIRGNYSQLCRVMSNLLNNAREASDEKGVVEVSMLEAGGEVSIKIKDYGCGIPASLQKKIFDRGASFGKEKGTGFGLYHAKSVVEHMGGELSFTSVQGEGTEFIVKVAKSSAPSWACSEIGLRQCDRVIIVDDDPRHAERIQRQLEGSGVKISVCDHPDVVDKSVIQSKATFVVMDNNFGSQYGYGLEWLSINEVKHCILVTADWALHDVQSAAERAGVAMIGKDFIGNLNVL